MTKYIHPKTGTVREVADTNQNKINLLKRAGFVDFATYRAPKKPKVVAEKSIADAVEENAIDPVDPEADGSEPELAIHISAPARRLVEKEGLDVAQIKGSGKDGQITKPDVKAYLESLEEKEPEKEPVAETASEAPETAEDVDVAEDVQEPGEVPETAPEGEGEETE